jgi:hypothetical protein
MARANPNTFCTKWLEQSNAMTEEEHAELSARERDAKQLAWLANNDEEWSKEQQRKRDAAPHIRALNDTKVFSLFKAS